MRASWSGVSKLRSSVPAGRVADHARGAAGERNRVVAVQLKARQPTSGTRCDMKGIRGGNRKPA